MNKFILLGGVSIVSMAIGGGVSYFLTRNHVHNQVAQAVKDLEEELATTRKIYKRRYKKDEFSTPTKVLRNYQDHITDYEPPVKTVDENWDEEEELKNRDTDKPYIISATEYATTRLNYVKTDLTYYENDDIIIDGGTVPYPDVDNLLGDANLQRFGVGSTSKDIVYIRNEELETDFEVDRTRGDFSEEVLGFIQHTHSRGRGKVLKMLREEE